MNSDPGDWDENPNLAISAFDELPSKDFGVNQHMIINQEFKEALRQILWQFRAPIRYAFAYGSGVFPQVGSAPGSNQCHPSAPAAIKNMQQGQGKMIDFIFGVSYSQHWHSLNLHQHRDHYSGIGSLGSYVVSQVQDRFGAGVYFNPYITVNGTLIKYGVVNLDTLCRDLSSWDTLYLAGRLQKPVKILRDHPRVRLANQMNLLSAVRVALLLLPHEFTEFQLYSTIAGISYMGDLRMVLPAEDPKKVNNIVSGQMANFRRLYAPLIENLPNVTFRDKRCIQDEWIDDPDVNARLVQDMDPVKRGNMVRRLPESFREKLYFQYQTRFELPRAEFDKMIKEANDNDPELVRRRQGGPYDQRIAKDANLTKEVQASITKTIRWPSTVQTIKGPLTSGVSRTWRYLREKQDKYKKSGKHLSPPRRPVRARTSFNCNHTVAQENDGTNVLLDANENAYGPGLALNAEGALQESAANGAATGASKPDIDLLGLNRYPDPHQIDLKQLFCNLRSTHIHSQKDLKPENLFVGVGSDEAIDALLRCFCVPGKDKILTCPPTYGMYAVSAQVNDVEIVKVPLDVENGFQLQPEKINETLSADPSIKMTYICSPGNPTANLIRKEDIQKVLEHPTWNGVVVVDEAYIDFAPEGSSLAEWVNEWPNLVVMQTLSKAFGLAGIRLGVAFTSPEIALLLNSLKAPYNISSPTSALAMAALSPKNMSVMQNYRQQIITQRDRLVQELPKIPGVGRFLGGYESNFLLVELLDKPASEGGKPSNKTALAAYEAMAEKRGVVVRFRGKELGCEGCLRITVGTEREVTKFLQELRVVLGGILSGTDIQSLRQ
ncbi:mitochondrial matrix Mmp37-domain-containing protein [Aspergillus ambiguus]|uniref:mitochondrial matrix Mmp37-domain-containing protein n=1 Tax=Aspergillus ambiguus TaxID=176160 RepID=UPI003CCDDFFB